LYFIGLAAADVRRDNITFNFDFKAPQNSGYPFPGARSEPSVRLEQATRHATIPIPLRDLMLPVTSGVWYVYSESKRLAER
jgi:hypothetical protein